LGKVGADALNISVPEATGIDIGRDRRR
jgi:hypothetical protein